VKKHLINVAAVVLAALTISGIAATVNSSPHHPVVTKASVAAACAQLKTDLAGRQNSYRPEAMKKLLGACD
jgi:hypothetical protein